MIDIAQYEADLAALPGDNLIVPRTQMQQLLAEAKSGQAAKRLLSSINTIASLGAGMQGGRA
jgi:hypothetical protein